MAEFCNNCSEKYKQKVDIDVVEIHAKLNVGYEIQTDAICEGCGLIGVWNDGTNVIKVAYSKNNKISWGKYIPVNRGNNDLPEWLLDMF